MTSSINPNNIDGTYPIAGQDNNSQGFRDNFTNTKTNFGYAETEINDLQSKAVLKAALTGTTLNNDMLGSPLINAQIQDFSATRVALGTVSGAVGINYAAGHYQTVTTSGSITLAFTNFPAAGYAGLVRVQVTVASTAHTMTLPAAVTVGTVGIEGISGQVITFASTGTFEFEFVTNDGGSTVTIFDLNRPLATFVNPIFLASSEDLANAAAASLAVTNSFFTTSAAETATLAAGTNGQIKAFSAVDITSGNMVITVTNAGWKASGTGTITFSVLGSGCTLQYVNSKWFCIGNNGVAFA
ncbi:hypothetical protein UFOVP1146_227 [uncultured Caudovirales phage]|uniref:Uncharacterized protein n=1 Tax=uncultured Caudovirales phage TaxID=2100421 RepID=A0A6J5T129_9CAUD|nr:hypothetical protein UFOVP812_140 [uncultured Caudovirales phage]CAB4165121.1 hypothetical protein UFOVP818_3 [uncultured Caudovirales phage]CAB4186881.1 hypothetical protein UFOVP1146_227 [uncultured Caudovirales phage]CAB4221473.1 hypothetical protein UFOVP1638_338 [uncultured Caudovirales phage]